jgi:hypothetical protein
MNDLPRLDLPLTRNKLISSSKAGVRAHKDLRALISKAGLKKGPPFACFFLLLLIMIIK